MTSLQTNTTLAKNRMQNSFGSAVFLAFFLLFVPLLLVGCGGGGGSGNGDIPSDGGNNSTSIIVTGLDVATIQALATTGTLVSNLNDSGIPVSSASSINTRPRDTVALLVGDELSLIGFKAEDEAQVDVSPSSTAVYMVLKIKQLTQLPTDKLHLTINAIKAHAAFPELVEYIRFKVESGIIDPLNGSFDPHLMNLVMAVAKDIDAKSFESVSGVLMNSLVMATKWTLDILIPPAYADTELGSIGSNADLNVSVEGDEISVTNYRYPPYFAQVDDGSLNLISGRSDSMQFNVALPPIESDEKWGHLAGRWWDSLSVMRGSETSKFSISGISTGTHRISFESLGTCRLLGETADAAVHGTIPSFSEAQYLSVTADTVFNIILPTLDVVADANELESMRKQLGKEVSKSPQKYVDAVKKIVSVVNNATDKVSWLKDNIKTIQVGIGIFEPFVTELEKSNANDEDVKKVLKWAKAFLTSSKEIVDVAGKFIELSEPTKSESDSFTSALLNSLQGSYPKLASKLTGMSIEDLGTHLGRYFGDDNYRKEFDAEVTTKGLFSIFVDWVNGDLLKENGIIDFYDALVEAGDQNNKFSTLGKAYNMAISAYQHPVISDLINTIGTESIKSEIKGRLGGKVLKKALVWWKAVETGWSAGTNVLPRYWDSCTSPTKLSISVKNGVARSYDELKFKLKITDAVTNKDVYVHDTINDINGSGSVKLHIGNRYRISVEGNQIGVFDRSNHGTDAAHIIMDGNFLTTTNVFSARPPQLLYAVSLTGKPKDKPETTALNIMACTRKGFLDRTVYSHSVTFFDSGERIGVRPFSCASGVDGVTDWGTYFTLSPAFWPGKDQTEDGIKYDTILFQEKTPDLLSKAMNELATIATSKGVTIPLKYWDELVADDNAHGENADRYGFGGNFRYVTNEFTLSEPLEKVHLRLDSFAGDSTLTHDVAVTVSPLVEYFDCATPTFGKTMSCTATGTNLPLASGAFTLDAGGRCVDIKEVSVTDTKHTFTCTPTIAGNIAFTLSGGGLDVPFSKDVLVADTDNEPDGMPDYWETQHHLDITKNDASLDYDGDGFTNIEEFNAGTSPDNVEDMPINLTAYVGNGLVNLTWSDNQAGDYTYGFCIRSFPFELPIGTHESFPCEDFLIERGEQRWQATQVSPDVVKNLDNDHPYYFAVLAKDMSTGRVRASAVVPATPTAGTIPATSKLNDTGITTCSSANQNGQPCPLLDYPGQDGDFGRDVTANDDSDGHAGFSFTKISSTGQELPSSATEWSCVKDNVTGLMWEIKTDDGGLHDKDWTYTWYEPDNTKNGGNAGTQNGGNCGGTGQCDTYSYVQEVNAAGWCGAQDWRMPSWVELLSLVSYDSDNPAIDIVWFPNTLSRRFWSGSPNVFSKSYIARSIRFDDGYSEWYGKGSAFQVRLVRSR